MQTIKIETAADRADIAARIAADIVRKANRQRPLAEYYVHQQRPGKKGKTVHGTAFKAVSDIGITVAWNSSHTLIPWDQIVEVDISTNF